VGETEEEQDGESTRSRRGRGEFPKSAQDTGEGMDFTQLRGKATYESWGKRVSGPLDEGHVRTGGSIRGGQARKKPESTKSFHPRVLKPQGKSIKRAKR